MNLPHEIQIRQASQMLIEALTREDWQLVELWAGLLIEEGCCVASQARQELGKKRKLEIAAQLEGDQD